MRQKDFFLQTAELVDVGALLAAGVPDADGDLIPPTTSFGTATVEVADGRLAPRILASASQFYPALALGGGTFLPCTGVEQILLHQNPTAGLVGGFDFLTAEADWSDGTNTDVTQDASFSTVDPVIATVQDGGADHGKVDFLGAGGTDAVSFTFVPVFDPEDPLFCAFFALLALAAVLSDDPPSVSVSLSSSTVAPQGQTMVTVSTSPATPGLFVSLQVQEVPNTGGHISHIPRPPAALGSLAVSSGTTDAQGKFTTTYTASQFAGSEVVHATVSGNTGIETVQVAVTGFSEITQEGTSYRLTGSTPTHPNNHFATPFVVSKLLAVADDYFAATNYRILFNDMSLEKGGLFDIGPPPSNCATCLFWNPPHDFHRIGRDTDVNNCSEINSTLYTEIVVGNGGQVDMHTGVAGCSWHTTF